MVGPAENKNRFSFDGVQRLVSIYVYKQTAHKFINAYEHNGFRIFFFANYLMFRRSTYVPFLFWLLAFLSTLNRCSFVASVQFGKNLIFSFKSIVSNWMCIAHACFFVLLYIRRLNLLYNNKRRSAVIYWIITEHTTHNRHNV